MPGVGFSGMHREALARLDRKGNRDGANRPRAASSATRRGGEPRGESTRRRAAEEVAFLAEYDAAQYPRPSVAVDIVVFTIIDADLKVLLIRRQNHPFKGAWALPGGFVRVGESADDRGEDLDEAAARRLSEETKLPRG